MISGVLAVAPNKLLANNGKSNPSVLLPHCCFWRWDYSILKLHELFARLGQVDELRRVLNLSWEILDSCQRPRIVCAE